MCAHCRATPEVAPYPFTTLTPNLGVLQSGSQDRGDVGDDDEEDEFAEFGLPGQRQRQSTVLADLPGLIEGAHAVSAWLLISTTVCKKSVNFFQRRLRVRMFSAPEQIIILYGWQSPSDTYCGHIKFEVSQYYAPL